MSVKYQFNDETIVYEILDNEVVLVNLESGYYYVLDDIASVIWMAVKDGSTADEIVQSLHATYTVPLETIQVGVSDLIAELVQENIFQPESANEPAALSKSGEAAQSKGKNTGFHMPSMFKYTDMEYLIQMDPIWDYDETGWPKRRTNPPATKN